MNVQDTLALVNEKWINVLAVDIGQEGGWCTNNFADIRNRGRLFIGPNEETPLLMMARMAERRPKIIYAEDVHTMPGQGIVSNGRLMEQKGELTGVAAAFSIAPTFIRPIEWIQCFTMKRTKHFPTKKKWKQHLLEIAQSLSPFPDDRITLKTADAFLMWYYAASQQTPEPLKPKGTLIL